MKIDKDHSTGYKKSDNKFKTKEIGFVAFKKGSKIKIKIKKYKEYKNKNQENLLLGFCNIQKLKKEFKKTYFERINVDDEDSGGDIGFGLFGGEDLDGHLFAITKKVYSMDIDLNYEKTKINLSVKKGDVLELKYKKKKKKFCFIKMRNWFMKLIILI
jgi:hypothetical protein